MKTEPTQHHRRVHHVFRALGLVAGLTVAIASGSSDAAPAPNGGAARVAGSARVDKDQYLVQISPAGSCAVGKDCAAEIKLSAKGAFHINDKFPIKFKAADAPPEGVSYPKPLVKREDGKFAEKEGSLPVPFKAAKAGKAHIAGTFSFSVCTDANCLMEKVDLEVDVDVK